MLQMKRFTSSKENSNTLQIPIGCIDDKKHLKALNRVKTTKYNWWSFIIVNFYEQFRRAVYFYFLLITIVSFFVNDTISPFTSLIPLLFVMIITALKEGLEDIQRSKSDKIVNTTKVSVLRNGQEKLINSEFVVPGDLVVINRNDDVPCDMVLLQSSDVHKKCFIITANLDGETNVKTIHVPENYFYLSEYSSNPKMGCIVCELPTPDLYNFNGRIEQQQHQPSNNSFDNDDKIEIHPLAVDNILLRGVRVVNTKRVVGCAIYTGMNTKLQLNSRYTGNKSSSSETYINKFIIALIIGMLGVVLMLYLIERSKESKYMELIWYLELWNEYDINEILVIFEDFLSFLILFNYMVPLSMYMNIEIYRIYGAIFMRNDLKLYDEATDQQCIVNATNLNEELGQINILFSDKTGTLTRNEMIFKKCSISGKIYNFQNTQLYCPETTEELQMGKFSNEIMNFLEALCLCHSIKMIQIETEIGNTHNAFKWNSIQEVVDNYQASSPEEKAILEGCAKLGNVFYEDNNDNLYVRRIVAQDDGGDKQMILENENKYERLHILEFSSERKRMSVIVRDAKGSIWLYSKGADNVIFPLCKPQSIDAMADKDIIAFAKEGLRTLAVGRRQLTESEFLAFLNAFRHANSELSNRTELIAKCYAMVENDLSYLGATALEDSLQENVVETLQSLQLAGIQIWVLTGDKVETALNIGLACGHIPAEAALHMITESKDVAHIQQCLNDIRKSVGDSVGCLKSNALVVDGTSIETLLLYLAEEFSEVASLCNAVLCCRLSPLQKCEIVKMVKKQKAERKTITAAIGDGANDVSMIQEAHVGIGVMGKEGMQAARCADYAIVKFSMLQRLLLVHGHYNSERLSFLVLFYCYKNIVITGCMALYQFHDLYSATSVYNDLYLWLFDIIYISISFTFLAIVEKPYQEDVLLRWPQLYKTLSHNKPTSWWIFTKWILNGFLHTFIIFYFAYAMIYGNNAILIGGQTADDQCFGTMLITLVILVGNVKIILTARSLTYVNFYFILASIAAFMFSTYVYNIIASVNLYWVFNMYVSSLSIWLYIVVCTVACLLADFTVKAIKDMLLVCPNYQQKQLV